MTSNCSRVAAGAIGAFIVVGTLAGCGTSGQKASPPVPQPSPSPAVSTDPAAAASQDALVAYNGAIAEWVRAGTTSDNHDAQLADHMSGQALTNTQLALGSTKLAGVHFEGKPTDDPQVKQLVPPTAPTQVLIVDCMNAVSWIGHKADGSVADTGPNGKHRVEAVVERGQDGWKVTHMIVRAVGTC